MNLKNPPRTGKWAVMPFYVDIVNSRGLPIAIPFPSYEKPVMSFNEAFNRAATRVSGVSLFQKRPDTVGNLSPENYAKSVQLLINPASLNINMSKIINRTQTMTGWIEEHWGEELDTITFQGFSAAFVTGGNNTTNDARIINQQATLGAGIVKNSSRRDSLSYKNMRDLVKIFNTNGLVYDSDGFVTQRYFIQITYDYGCYRGYFESFDITEEASNPFRFNYTVTFKVEKTVYTLGTRRWDTSSEELEPGASGMLPTILQALGPAPTSEGPVSPPPAPFDPNTFQGNQRYNPAGAIGND